VEHGLGLVTGLAAALADVLGATDVEEPTRLSGGASRETFRFTADGRPLILQRQRAGDVRDMGVEAAALRAARAAGVPVPELVASSNAASEIGSAYMVLGWVDGETIARKIQRDERFAAARDALPGQFGAALARLHRIDPSSVPGLTAGDQVRQYREVFDSFGDPHPAFELAFRWLERNRPPASEPRVVHGDFRLGNVMVDEAGLAAVLDWELVHVGDPMDEVGDHVHDAGQRPPLGGIAEPRTGRHRSARLRERVRPVPRARGSLVSLHDAPSVAQIVEAVREWIERDVLAGTTGRLQFHARVAMNMLAMVERELAVGPDQQAAHAERLAALGCTDDAELSARIRSGELDDRLDEVREDVRASVLDKLAVANPRYVEPPAPGAGVSA